MTVIRHSKFKEAIALVGAGLSVLLLGDRGTGKTTLAEQVAEELKIKFYTISMTRQTTLGHLLGYRSITTGDYIPTSLYEAVKDGGLMLLDELNAGDPNVILALNTLENGYLAFPTGIVKCHKDFRLMATANPTSSKYTGRAVLDAATTDRFEQLPIERDTDLEKSLVDDDVYKTIMRAREVLTEYGNDIEITTRDAMRYQVRKELGLAEGYLLHLLKGDIKLHLQVVGRPTMPDYHNFDPARSSKQEDAKTLKDLITLLGEPKHG
jgi:GTPase SAR1 family protein